MAQAIEDLLREERTFPPPSDFQQGALVADRELHDRAEQDRLAFWEDQARELDWFEEWDAVLEWDLPYAKWFVGGKLNASHNCLDRHVEAGRGDKVAFHWEGEPGDTRTITYADLLDEVQRFANVLKDLGVTKGDRVAIYLPMIPELPVALLACARIGAPHSVVFGGFSADSLRDRIIDAEATLLITADGGWRRGDVVDLKAAADEAVAETPTIEHVVVVRRTENDVAMTDGRDHWYHEVMADAAADCPAEPMDAEDLLYILYTSGTTGKPKGIMHTTGGYMTQVTYTHRYVFDLHPDEDVFWCTADIGWVTGHSYIVYGPLANGATSVMYEGAPNHPGPDRLWEICDRYDVTIFYTAPTAIRAFMKWGDEHPEKHDLSSLRVLGTVGEPINPEAWVWYWQVIGGERCPVVDTWWQTETGGIMISPLPGVTTLKPGSATFPLPGISARVVDEQGEAVDPPGGGYLVLTEPWPAMLRGIWGDPERYEETYWSRFEGRYFAGDGAKRDEDGYFWVLGRVDDVMNVSGHRISTAEVESALVSHDAVAEAAVIGRRDAATGQAIAAFVSLRGGRTGDEELVGELRDHVAKVIGPIAKPKTVLFTDDLPKTRSGKIMRRLLKDIAEDEQLGDTTTLADASVVNEIKQRYLEKQDARRQRHGPATGGDVNWRSVIAALPFLRWLWRWLPGPLRLIVVALAVVIAISRLLRSDTPTDAAPPRRDDTPSADEPSE
jgi:acetyl-CoA synthetase